MTRPNAAGLAAAAGTVLLAVGLTGGGPAFAAGPAAPYRDLGQVRAALAKSAVYIADDAQDAKSVSATKLLKTLHSDRRIIVVVLPAKAGTAAAVAGDLTTGTGGRVAIVLSGTGDISAAAMKDATFATGAVEALAQAAGKAHPGHPEAALESTIGRIRSAAPAAPATPAAPQALPKLSSGHGTATALIVLGILVLAGLAVAAAVTGSRRRQRVADTAAAGELADVQAMHDRLSAELAELDKPTPSPSTTSNVTVVGGAVAAGPDAPTRLAMEEAAERRVITADLLGLAGAGGDQSREALHSAKRTAIEGLSAARAARRRLSRPLGPDPLPLPPSEARQVQGQQTVAVGNRTYTGYGQYQPGAGHYFGGGHYQGAYVSGGWYGTPFWRMAQIPSIEWGGLGFSLGYDGPGAHAPAGAVDITKDAVPEGAHGGE